MVAGDLVNTAARIQSVAPSGTLFVGEATKRASEAAIVYEDAGAHELKGKAEPVQLWRAVRVIAGARGALKSEGLEAPFVGRDPELRTLKERFFACGEDRKSHLVSIVGIAGIGKSRLSWEFYKYFDGLPQITWYHRGRCLAYGEGVTYWALAEMVRMRARIATGQAARRGGGARQGPRGAQVGVAPPGPSDRPGGTNGRGPGGPVCGMAAVLRTPGRDQPYRLDLRGHAVGR